MVADRLECSDLSAELLAPVARRARPTFAPSKVPRSGRQLVAPLNTCRESTMSPTSGAPNAGDQAPRRAKVGDRETGPNSNPKRTGSRPSDTCAAASAASLVIRSEWTDRQGSLASAHTRASSSKPPRERAAAARVWQSRAIQSKRASLAATSSGAAAFAPADLAGNWLVSNLIPVACYCSCVATAAAAEGPPIVTSSAGQELRLASWPIGWILLELCAII
jgi:hypothetical protein